MKLWEQYILEREGAKIIYDDNCFVTYKILGESEILVVDLYVVPEFRKTGMVQDLWNRLLSETKAKFVQGMTDRNALNWQASHSFMLSFGFKTYQEDGSMIYYYLETGL